MPANNIAITNDLQNMIDISRVTKKVESTIKQSEMISQSNLNAKTDAEPISTNNLQPKTKLDTNIPADNGAIMNASGEEELKKPKSHKPFKKLAKNDLLYVVKLSNQMYFFTGVKLAGHVCLAFPFLRYTYMYDVCSGCGGGAIRI